jgi:nucleotide-binding universal stress UspA family protein
VARATLEGEDLGEVMTEHRTVLVGTDGSESSLAAVRWAAGEAQRRNTDLQVVHAYEELWLTADAVPVRTFIELARKNAEEILADARVAAHAVAPDLNLHTDGVLGEPAATLLKAATTAGLLVVGNRGRGGFTSLLLGSVGHRVATHASCPTVIVRGCSVGQEGPIVVGADGSPAADRALHLAFEEAVVRHTGVVAIRSYEPPATPPTPGMPGIPPLTTGPEVDAAGERVRLGESLAPWRDKYPGVSVEGVVARGNPARILAGASHTAQLLVVGNRGHGSLVGTMLGSVSLKLLHHADCPVVIARA